MDNFSRIHGGNTLEAAQAYGLNPAQIIDFSSNINPLGPPAGVMSVLRENIGQITRYPDAGYRELRAALGQWVGVNPEQIVPGNGAAELFFLLVRSQRPRRVLVMAPSFAEYEAAARSAGAEIVRLPLDPQAGFVTDWLMLERYLSQVDMIFLGNPNNPTGNLLEADGLTKLAAAATRYGVTLVLDESFLPFTPDFAARTMVRRTADFPGLWVIISLTKFYAIPGLRLGFAVAAPALVTGLLPHKDPWNVNCLAAVAGVAAVADRQYTITTRELIMRERDWLTSRLGQAGVRVFPAAANFLFADVRALSRTGADIYQELARQGVLIRNCASYPGLDGYYIRVAVKDHPANEILTRAWEKLTCPAVKEDI